MSFDTVFSPPGHDDGIPKFSVANRKLGAGSGLVSFDMTPSKKNCPGAAHAGCRELCWAKRNSYASGSSKNQLAINSAFSRTNHFSGWCVDQLSNNAVAARIPGTGDFYSATFVRKVIDVARALPDVRFWCYTRCWWLTTIWAALEELGRQPNVSLWLSVDRKMLEHHGPPPACGLPVCWLAIDDGDVPLILVDLVWRNRGKNNRPLPPQQILGNCVVCPHEDGVTETTCARCGMCWREKKFRNVAIAALLTTAQSSTIG